MVSFIYCSVGSPHHRTPTPHSPPRQFRLCSLPQQPLSVFGRFDRRRRRRSARRRRGHRRCPTGTPRDIISCFERQRRPHGRGRGSGVARLEARRGFFVACSGMWPLLVTFGVCRVLVLGGIVALWSQPKPFRKWSCPYRVTIILVAYTSGQRRQCSRDCQPTASTRESLGVALVGSALNVRRLRSASPSIVHPFYAEGAFMGFPKRNAKHCEFSTDCTEHATITVL